MIRIVFYLFTFSFAHSSIYNTHLSTQIKYFSMSEANDRRKRLAQLAAQRRSGKSRVESYEETPMYDIVDEDQYRKKLEEDDFVEVNDGDHGYTYDDGTNDLGDSKHNYYSDDDEAELYLGRTGPNKKRKTKAVPVPEPSKPVNKSIKNFLAPVVKEKPVSLLFDFPNHKQD